MRYATALAEYADAGGYDLEVTWDVCTVKRTRRAVRPGEVPVAQDAVRRRAEAAGAGVPAARARRGAAARRARQLPRRAGQALARGPHQGVRQDDPATSATTASCSTTPRPGSSPSSSAPRATWPGCTPAASTSYHEARKDRFARLEEMRTPLGRGARQAQGAGADVQAEGGVQRRHGLALPGGADPAARSSRRPARRRAAARAAGEDAPQRRPHRQARGRLRGARAHRPDEAVRPRGLVRRAGAVLGSNGSGKSHFLRLLAAAAAIPTWSTSRSRRRRRSSR